MLVDQQGEPKSLQTDRVVLVAGATEETTVVQDIYRRFVHEGRLGCPTDLGRPWTRGTVHQVLTNEKYIGNSVYNRISFKLEKKRVANPPDMWIRREGAFDAVVEPRLFYTAQGMIQERSRRFSEEELLGDLRRLFERHGQLSGTLIDETEGMPSSAVDRGRFGSLIRAYHLIGYTPARDYRYLAINRHLRRLHADTVREVIGEIERLGGAVERNAETDLLTINDEFTTSLVLARCRSTDGGTTERSSRYTRAVQGGPETRIARQWAFKGGNLDDGWPMWGMSAARSISRRQRWRLLGKLPVMRRS